MKEKNINTIMILISLMKRINMKLYIGVLLVCLMGVERTSAQQIVAKSNLLYDLTTTINIGLEVSMAPKWTVDLPVSYNPWGFADDKKLKHWLIQPEVRYWLCEKFNGHFVGLHAHIGAYNVAGIEWLGLKDYRYEGNIYGAGLTYGYQWILNPSWSLEANIGLGYAYLSHAQYPCGECMPKITNLTRNYLGPTRAGVSLIYIIK
jgi:hypothetical protein